MMTEAEVRSLWIASGRAGAIGLLIVIGASGCAVKSTSSPVPVPSQLPTSSPSATGGPATTPAAAASTKALTATGSGGVQDLTATTSVRSALLTAYAAVKELPVSDVAGSEPGSLYYSYVPVTKTYWATASYNPVPGAPLAVTVSFQDGGETGLFKKVGSGPWQAVPGTDPNYCRRLRFFPRAVLAAWSMPTTIPAGGQC
jgi:hypothetical protein